LLAKKLFAESQKTDEVIANAGRDEMMDYGSEERKMILIGPICCSEWYILNKKRKVSDF
jgi:hypothetical protein